MRMRGFKPEIFTDVKTGTLPSESLKLFIGLLSVSDDYGVSELCIHSYRAQIFPYSIESPESLIKPYLDMIITRNLARIFEHKGKTYLFINNFRKHQNVNRYQDPLLPGWIKGDTPESYFLRLNSVSANEPFSDDSVSTHCRREEKRREKNNINTYQDINTSGKSEKSETAISFVLNDKSKYEISQAKVEEWKELFPSVDVMMQLRKAKAWCIDNPTRRKTKNGILRFLNTWLGKEQDNGAKVIKLQGGSNYARHEKPIESAAEKLARQQLNEFTG